MSEKVSLDTVTVESFIPYVSSVFTLRLENGEEGPLTLSEAKALRGSNEKRQPFSLVFTGTPGVVLPQAIYSLHHDVMGQIDLFIVPIGATAEATTYQAVFN